MIKRTNVNGDGTAKIGWKKNMPAKLDRCVDDVKSQGKVDNPWAVCNASLSETENCAVCGKPQSEHGVFTDHQFQEANVKPYPPFNNDPGLDEAVGISGDLSNVSIGAKKKTQEIECKPCEMFDAIHENLTS